MAYVAVKGGTKAIEASIDRLKYERLKEKKVINVEEAVFLGDDEEFLEFIRAFETESRPRILEWIKKYPDKAVVTFRTREEAEGYLAGLEG